MIITITDVYNPDNPIVKDVEYNGELPQPTALIDVLNEDGSTMTYLVGRHVFQSVWIEPGFNVLASFVTIQVGPHIAGLDPKIQIENDLEATSP